MDGCNELQNFPFKIKHLLLIFMYTRPCNLKVHVNYYTPYVQLFNDVRHGLGLFWIHG